ncbi:MAG: hypothetical protein DLM57_08950 [Pseudonocardiales bacterium]|nr:MAG: hypothetical protein DLM57_08950 [Pseudonocardiales bacterium]
MRDLEQALREVMRAADSVAPDASTFRFRAPSARRDTRGWVRVGAVAAAVCVTATVAFTVILTRSSGGQVAAPPVTRSPVPAAGLTCPLTPPPASAAAGAGRYPLPAPAADALTVTDRLAPTEAPVHALACAYIRPHHDQLTTGSGLVDNGLSNIPALMAWAPPGPEGPCPLNLLLTDVDLYLVGLMYPTGTLWISAPANHCSGSSNGRFTTQTHLAAIAKAAIDAGAWPTPSGPAPCTAIAGRLGQQQQMVPAGPTSVTVCRDGAAASVREGTTAQLHALRATINALPTQPDQFTFHCNAPSYRPSTDYTITFSYAVGPAVTVRVAEPCTPAIQNGNLQAADASAVLPILTQILANPPALTYPVNGWIESSSWSAPDTPSVPLPPPYNAIRVGRYSTNRLFVTTSTRDSCPPTIAQVTAQRPTTVHIQLDSHPGEDCRPLTPQDPKTFTTDLSVPGLANQPIQITFTDPAVNWTASVTIP